ncbi:energy-coupling factor transporter transmembrane protein EcfT [uncultured Desulfuromonas sp.]|uniref:energy-coupling factor transporter transmembrane component T family protein n=1 Tax=uncultured Desulfuromonas sp. TaxID=181013 RepID=UPI002633DF68|nr:energy-coupling factor transporter transmembrane protein EcfT [uncultured Desulfuromonas sp.]
MAVLEHLTLGRYLDGDSLLHRLDPRIKLAGVPLLVVASFSGTSFSRVAVLAVLAFACLLASGIGWRVWGRGLWVFRWLFLFTLLLHLLLSPGHTLFGTAWLSRDGLLRGLLVCAQLGLAVVFASLLTLTTTPRELAASFAALLAPLRRIGFPLQEATRLLLLVLQFIPILRDEALRVAEEGRAAGLDPGGATLVGRGRFAGRLVAPLVLGLVDHADALARAEAAGENVGGELPRLRAVGELKLFEWLFVIAVGFGLAALWTMLP